MTKAKKSVLNTVVEATTHLLCQATEAHRRGQPGVEQRGGVVPDLRRILLHLGGVKVSLIFFRGIDQTFLLELAERFADRCPAGAEAGGQLVLGQLVARRQAFVVETDDALLITTLEHAQDVGKVVKYLDEKKLEKLT